MEFGIFLNGCRDQQPLPAQGASGAPCRAGGMLDHVTNRRFEWGTGRGAGSHEMAAFNILDTNSTKSERDEVSREIPRMWEQVDYPDTTSGPPDRTDHRVRFLRSRAKHHRGRHLRGDARGLGERVLGLPRDDNGPRDRPWREIPRN